MAEQQQLGFREVIPDQSALLQWRNITIDTGAAQSTLQDIKVPEYGGGYAFTPVCPATRNRYLFWRVCHDVVELWEESLDHDFTHNHIQLRFADTPVLEGLSVHETQHHVYILLATVSSVHRFCFPHPQVSQGSKGRPQSILSDLTFHTLKDYHYLHLLNTTAAGEGLPHTAGTHLVTSEGDEGEAVFVLGQSGGALLVVVMSPVSAPTHHLPHPPPPLVAAHTIKNSSLMNRLFTGFVPGMFRSVEGCETVSSVVVLNVGGEAMAMGVCRDTRVRAWSCHRLQCILAHDTLENTAEASRKLTPGAQRHQIRKEGKGESAVLGVFLTFAEKHLLLVYRPTSTPQGLSLTHLQTLYPPQHDLVDFCLSSSHIWTLWTDANNDTQLMYAGLEDGYGDRGSSCDNNSEGGWRKPPGLRLVVLEPSPDREVPLTDPFLDPREVYLRELFTPNRFSAHTLRKALSIYRRSVEPVNLGEGGMSRLQEEVEAALRDQVEARVTSDMTREEVSQVTLEAWATFYSHTLQYHQVGQKPVGLVGSGCGVVRKQVVSWVRGVDVLEVVVCGDADDVVAGAVAGVVSEDPGVTAALLALARPLRLLRTALAPEQAAAFSLDLHHLQPPDQLAGDLASCLLGQEPDLGSTLSRQLAGLPGLVPGLWAYLHALQLDQGLPDSLALVEGSNPGGEVDGALGGRAGAGLVGAVVQQMGRGRLELCRDLLVLQQAALLLAHQSRLAPDAAATLRSTLLPKTALLTQAYFALLHLASAPAERPTRSTLEAARRQLAALSLGPGPSPPPQARPATVLELFFMGTGGDQARTAARHALDQTSAGWAGQVLPLAATVAQLAWPISRCLALLEWLVWAGQHEAVQQYVRLLQPWCEWNSCSRKFLLGVSLLNQGEASKAAALLLAAWQGVSAEDFLAGRVAGGGPDTPEQQLRVTYCLRVIRLLEQSGQGALALLVAQKGVTAAATDSHALAALYSVVFKHQLDLHHHDEAFTALLACPSHTRRRDLLRQLVVALHDRRCLETLIEYQYGDLAGEVVTILENRARSADILINNYYHLLYAFHVSKHNYKKAACVMYECALRLNVEGVGERGVKQQAKCYLACINCLHHIPSDQAWILKPVPRSVPSEEASQDCDMDGGISPKRSSEGAPVAPPLPRTRPQVTVLELPHIQREYQLVHARLLLLRSLPDIPLSGGPLSPSDTISLLTHARLFKEAVRLARMFELAVTPILKGLANTCLHPNSHPPPPQTDANFSDAEEGWWSLLKQLLEEEEVGKQSVLHHAVATELLHYSSSLPTWLTDSYKMRNLGELLALYVRKGLLGEATELALQYVDAVMGHAPEQVGVSSGLHETGPAVWLPYTALDQLLLELDEVRQHHQYAKMRERLTHKLATYRKLLEQVSHLRATVLLRG
ncbi:hypothetical protein Pcinc_035022 [Petrolisthes cinctipes]|uniref:Nuclear pore complex protein Nup160 n=1 Tax=Petrolisthes cinctipes TaxID=88211 RepID=A0AAE1BYR7_PETCI|nr:hypothetical protein Pcinc_035022 [Petrolisthes cinctipes]